MADPRVARPSSGFTVSERGPQRGGNVSIITACTAGTTRWLAHLHRNLRLFQADSLLVVCAGDTETARFATKRGITRVLTFDESKGIAPAPAGSLGGTLVASVERHGERQSTSRWFDMVYFKQRCFWRYVQASSDGADVLMIDVDMTFFRNPLPLLREADADLSVMCEEGPAAIQLDSKVSGEWLNTGFMFVRVSERTRRVGVR